MSTIFHLKQNDTADVLAVILKDANNAIVNVTGAAIGFSITEINSTVPTVHRRTFTL